MRLLRENDFSVCDSGDGSHEGWFDEPYVISRCVREDTLTEADRLHLLLIGMGLEGKFVLNASYDPSDQSTLLMLFNLDDEALASVQHRLPN